MAETHGFIKVLPDSTGKRIPQTVMVEIDYNNGLSQIVTGDIIISSVTNIKGTVFEVEGSLSAGSLHVKIEDPIPNNIVFTIGEDLLVNNASKAKVASTGYSFYYQQLGIFGSRNPLNGWDIDELGSGSITFPEGAPTFDAFGKLLIAPQTTVAEYLNKYEMDVNKFSNTTIGTASIVHDPAICGLVFTTGTASGDTAKRISDQYHPYQLGKSRLIEITCAAGDSGKANLTRYWGYADEEDGLLFSLINTTLNVTHRSSVPGIPTVTNYPREEWNSDRLDGTHSIFNKSGMNLDVTKGNIYWIDLQWLGVGRVRFGTIAPDGRRIVCHTIKNANANNRIYMRTGSLPAYFKQTNTGVTASSSEFRLWCTVVKQGGEFTPSKKYYSLPTIAKTLTTTSHVPIVSLRSKQTINSLNNRIASFIDWISSMSATIMVEISIYDNTTLTGATFANDSGKAVEYDTAASALLTGTLIKSFKIKGGEEKDIDTSKFFNFLGHTIRRKSDITIGESVTITGKLISAGSSNVELIIGLSDI